MPHFFILSLTVLTTLLCIIYISILSRQSLGGRHGPVVISLASQGSSRGATLPYLKLAAFFPSGPRWQMWLKHRANY